MYKWRKMNSTEQDEILRLRKQHRRPWHSPPHRDSDSSSCYIVPAACYEHKHIAGENPSRLAQLEETLREICENHSSEISAWCVLPNHYHVMVRTDQMKELRAKLGRMHGRTSRQWNLEDDSVGRKVWFNCIERFIRSERHYWATINYIHHNPVKHGFVEKWDLWPFSSAAQYLDEIGRDKAAEIWKAYPVLDYGKQWDP